MEPKLPQLPADSPAANDVKQATEYGREMASKGHGRSFPPRWRSAT